MSWSHQLRRRLLAIAIPVLLVAVSFGAIAAVATLQHRSSHAREHQLLLREISVELGRMQSLPFQANPGIGGSAAVAQATLLTQSMQIEDWLTEFELNDHEAEVDTLRKQIEVSTASVTDVLRLAARGGALEEVLPLLQPLAESSQAVAETLKRADARYDAQAETAQQQALAGSVAAILTLLIAFGLIYRRAVGARRLAERYATQNVELLEASRTEALHDVLTGLRNRRGLTDDITAAAASATEQSPVSLAFFDLDGFKTYNDTFGHPAGDALLTRLGQQLRAATDGQASVYRVGGDEFCLLARAGGEAAAAIVQLASDALSARGDDFSVSASVGVAQLPGDARTGGDLMRLADERMYVHKDGRSSAARESTDVLLQVLTEREIDAEHQHVQGVAELATATAERLDLPEHEVRRIRLAAQLHDIGKVAMPDTILGKTRLLDDEEWDFVRMHTLIGERIIRAAPAIAHCAELVRSSHERWDGDGYPDRLAGEQIPLGARIITVCDAYDAMTHLRPYRAARPHDVALAELRACAGSQFDAAVVDALAAALAERHAAAVPALAA